MGVWGAEMTVVMDQQVRGSDKALPSPRFRFRPCHLHGMDPVGPWQVPCRILLLWSSCQEGLGGGSAHLEA